MMKIPTYILSYDFQNNSQAIIKFALIHEPLSYKSLNVVRVYYHLQLTHKYHLRFDTLSFLFNGCHNSTLALNFFLLVLVALHFPLSSMACADRVLCGETNFINER